MAEPPRERTQHGTRPGREGWGGSVLPSALRLPAVTRVTVAALGHGACCTQLWEDLAPPRRVCLWKSLPPSAEAGSGARGPRGGP